MIAQIIRALVVALVLYLVYILAGKVAEDRKLPALFMTIVFAILVLIMIAYLLGNFLGITI